MYTKSKKKKKKQDGNQDGNQDGSHDGNSTWARQVSAVAERPKVFQTFFWQVLQRFLGLLTRPGQARPDQTRTSSRAEIEPGPKPEPEPASEPNPLLAQGLQIEIEH